MEAFELLQALEGTDENDFNESELDADQLAERAARRASSRASRETPLKPDIYEVSSSEEENDDEPSLALVLVRAARPILRSVQWIANRVLGEKKTNLGANNKFAYDAISGQWILQKPEAPEPEEEEESSEEGTWSPPETNRYGRRSDGLESDGGMA